MLTLIQDGEKGDGSMLRQKGFNQDTIHGVTVHYVNQDLDAGQAIAQHRIDILKEDDASSLASRLLTKEHKLFPYCIGLIRQNRVEWREQKLYMDDRELIEPIVFWRGIHLMVTSNRLSK